MSKTGVTDHFYFNFEKINLMEHEYNCGDIEKRMTERCIEIPLLERWMKKNNVRNVVEIGATTPYYWPAKIKKVIDPFDPSEFVTDKISMFDTNFKNCSVISISTLEHIGLGEYGIKEEKSAVEAFNYIVDFCDLYFLSFPLGVNKKLDEYILNKKNIKIKIYSRNLFDNVWRREYIKKREYRYGPFFANSVAFLIKGKL